MNKIFAVLILVACAGYGQAFGSTSGTVSPTSLSFANLPVGSTSAAQSIVASNTGTVAIGIGNISTTGNFSQTNNCGSSIAVGSKCTISVAFTPKAAGTQTGSVVITSKTGQSGQIQLTGTGTTVSKTSYNLSPSSLTFAGQTVNTTSASQTVTFSNTGTTAITISGISASSKFSESNNCGTSLAAGASCSIVVLFDPTTTGVITGTVTIGNNASANPLTVALTGTGNATATHSVSVGWKASTTSGVSGYNLYRSTVSGGYYSRMNSSVLSSTTYADSNLSSGTTYYYVATSVGSNGVESGYSNQATAVIP